VGGTGRKEARIPEPWRLQLALPRPCAYFLRMDVDRHSTAADVLYVARTPSPLCLLPFSHLFDFFPLHLLSRREAARQCGGAHAVECFSLLADGAPLPADATMESSDFFNRRRALAHDPTCA